MLAYSRKLDVFRLLKYAPHGGQLKAHESAAPVLQIVGAERSGKSMFTAREAICELIPDPQDLRPRRVAFAAQSYDETRKEMEYLLADCHKLGLVRGEPSTPRQGKWQFETQAGGFVETVSLKEGGVELTARGEAYHLVCLVEAGRIAYNALMSALGRVSETRGRVIMSGTLWDDWGWYNDMMETFAGPNEFGGEVFSFPAWTNLAVYPGGRQDAQILYLERTLPEDEFKRRICAERVPSPARIFPEFSTIKHVGDVEIDPEGQLELTIDAGYFPSKYAAHALQRTADEAGRETLQVADELWVQHQTHQDVIATLKQRPWWGQVSRVYGGHETKQHPSQKSCEEVWREGTGLPFFPVERLARKLDGIMRVKTFLADPGNEGKSRIIIDPKCRGLAYEFAHYQRKRNPFGEVVSDEPDPMAEDDAIDALTNYLVGRFGLVDRAKKVGRKGIRRRSARG